MEPASGPRLIGGEAWGIVVVDGLVEEASGVLAAAAGGVVELVGVDLTIKFGKVQLVKANIEINKINPIQSQRFIHATSIS